MIFGKRDTIKRRGGINLSEKQRVGTDNQRAPVHTRFLFGRAGGKKKKKRK